MKNIGFIGASGMMGHGMARNIQAKGFALSVSVNRNRGAVADLVALGAKVVDSPADLGSCDAVWTYPVSTDSLEILDLGCILH